MQTILDSQHSVPHSIMHNTIDMAN